MIKKLNDTENGVYYFRKLDSEYKFSVVGDEVNMFIDGKKDHRITKRYHVQRMLTFSHYEDFKKLKTL